MSEFAESFSRLSDACARYASLNDNQRRSAHQAAHTCGAALADDTTSPAERAAGLGQLSALATTTNAGAATAGDALIGDVLASAVTDWSQRGPADAAHLAGESLDALERLYGALGRQSRTRHQLLRWLAVDGGTDALERFSRLLVSDPPQADEAIDWAVEPLFRQPPADVAALFPRLLDGLAHPVVAAVVLDLSHRMLREGVVSTHPAAERVDELAALLGELAERLSKLAETAASSAGDAESRRHTQQAIARSVALAAGLSEALAWIGARQHVGKLYQALDVPHRRVVVEAAAALARLGERSGVETLVRAAADPAARCRALAYLEELDELDSVDPECRSRAARAAGTLAAWLAEPSQFGFPPTSVELVEAVTQHWPGYEDAVDCTLLSYTYAMPQGELTGLGIVGPVTHATSVDLLDLPTSDAFAYFAGWHAQHDEITECGVAELSEAERGHLGELVRLLADLGFEDPQPAKLANFFGERVIVSTASRGGQPGTVIVTGSQMAEGSAPIWIAAGSTRHPIGPDDAYNIFKGREFLRIFN
ncbi:MAG: hypothetical protein KDA63_09260 [Planctomycetales bacterium]|nr:hypothetical protein [Planctomycetales bacterium]